MPIAFIYLGTIGHFQSQSTAQPWRAGPLTPAVFDKMTKGVARRTTAIRLWCFTNKSAYLG